MDTLKKVDPKVYQAIKNEIDRQINCLELIASENYVSEAVLAAQGSVLTNKYAEGYPQKRYYGGCQYYDVIESIAIERAKKLFKAEHANVQAHSGTQANMAVYFAVLKPGNTIMGMHLSHGGHLSHGHPASFSGQYFHTVPIGVDKKTELLNYDEIANTVEKYRPHLIVAGSSSYSRIIDWKKFKNICDAYGAYFTADIAHYAGLIAAGLYPSPVKYADFVTLTTHKTLRGPRGGMILCKRKYKELIDKMVFPGIQGGPLMHVIAAKAVALKEASTEAFKKYQEQVLKNSRALAAALALKGYRIVFGGTDCHMLLIDLRPKKITGLEAEKVLDKAGITVNKNSIPYDPEKPFVTSGIRLGTPAVTTRGMKEKEMEYIADLIDTALKNRHNESLLEDINNKVKKLLKDYPIYTRLHLS